MRARSYCCLLLLILILLLLLLLTTILILKYYIGVRSGMAQLEITLPEILVDDFERCWTRFELVAKAKEWNEDKQLSVIPALLRGKLLDAYMDIPEERKRTLAALKAALAEHTGITKDPLAAAKLFAIRDQQRQEKVADYATELKKLFTEAYPTEAATSTVFLQRFLSGLAPSIGKQVLLKGRPGNMEDAIKTAKEVEFALQFGERSVEQPLDVCTVDAKPPKPNIEQESITQLQKAVEELTKRMDTWEMRKRTSSDRQFRRRRDRREIRCYSCQEWGHYRSECPLNDQQPGSVKGRAWLDRQM